jgi:hypothetical protein
MKYNIAPLILLGFAVFYFISAVADYRRHEGSLSIAGKTRLRIGLIFTAVAAALLVFATKFR